MAQQATAIWDPGAIPSPIEATDLGFKLHYLVVYRDDVTLAKAVVGGTVQPEILDVENDSQDGLRIVNAILSEGVTQGFSNITKILLPGQTTINL